MKKSLLAVALASGLLLTACDNGKTELEANLKAAEEKLAEAQAASATKIAELQKALEEATKAHESKLAEVQQAADAKITETQKAADEKIAEIQKLTEEKMVALEKTLQEKIQEVKQNTLSDTWNGMKQSVGQAVENTKKVAVDKIDTLGKSLQGVASDLKSEESTEKAKSTETKETESK